MNKLFKLNNPNTELIWTPDQNTSDASSGGGLGVGAPPSGIINIDWNGYWKDFNGFHTSDGGFSPPNHSGNDGDYTVHTYTETNTDSSGRHYKTTVTITIDGTINSDGSYSGINSITISSYSEFV